MGCDLKCLQTGVERIKFFQAYQKRGQMDLILLCVGGENQAVDSNFGEKTASWYGDFKTALSSKPHKNNEISQMNNKNQGR